MPTTDPVPAGADPPGAPLLAALRRIAPAGVHVGVRRIGPDDLAALHPAEAASVRGAVAKRRQEFASGRVLLRELLGVDATILPGPTRAPGLPAGVRGSLAHDDAFAVAAVTRDASIASLGVDVEPATALAADVAAVVRRPEERGIDAHLAFTLKEAAYKAWSGLGGRILDHHDVSLTLDGECFEARVVAERTTFSGSWALADGRWLALVASPAS